MLCFQWCQVSRFNEYFHFKNNERFRKQSVGSTLPGVNFKQLGLVLDRIAYLYNSYLEYKKMTVHDVLTGVVLGFAGQGAKLPTLGPATRSPNKDDWLPKGCRKNFGALCLPNMLCFF